PALRPDRRRLPPCPRRARLHDDRLGGWTDERLRRLLLQVLEARQGRPGDASSTYEPLEHEQAISSYIAAQSGPCLVVWNMHLAHAPFHKPDASIMPPGWTAPGLVLTNQQKYEAMLIGADWQIGRVLSQLDLDDWLVIVVGDNGTPENIAPDPNRAKTTTLERGIHVPLFMVGAGLPAGTQTRLCHIADILPTLADYWNVPVPQGIDGIALVGLQHGWVISGTSE